MAVLIVIVIRDGQANHRQSEIFENVHGRAAARSRHLHYALAGGLSHNAHHLLSHGKVHRRARSGVSCALFNARHQRMGAALLGGGLGAGHVKSLLANMLHKPLELPIRRDIFYQSHVQRRFGAVGHDILRLFSHVRAA